MHASGVGTAVEGGIRGDSGYTKSSGDRSRTSPSDDLDLHHRYRFWLPFLSVLSVALAFAAFPLAPFLFSSSFLEISIGNFIVSQMYLALVPFTGQEVNALRQMGLSVKVPGSIPLFVCLQFAFWYAIGRGLDRSRSGTVVQPPRKAGWMWVVSGIAVGELIRLTLIDGPDFINRYPPIRFTFGPDPDRAAHIAGLPPAEHLNFLFVAYAIPVLAASTWLLALWQLRRALRAAYQEEGTTRRLELIGLVTAPVFLELAGRLSVFPSGAVLCLVLSIVFCATWFLPRVIARKILTIVSDQVRWPQLRRHLLFLTVLFGLIITDEHRGIFIDGILILLPWLMIYRRTWLTVQAFVSPIALLLSATTVVGFASGHGVVQDVVAVLLPWLSLRYVRVLAGDHWRDLRRHAFAVVTVLTGLTVWGIVSARSSGEGNEYLDSPYGTAILWLLVLVSAASWYWRWLFPGGRVGTPPVFWRRPSSRRPLYYIVGALVVWLVAVTARQNPALFGETPMYGCVTVAIMLLVPRSSRYRWIMFGALLCSGALYLAGSYDAERDLFLSLFGFAMVYTAWVVLDRRGWHMSQSGATLLLCCGVWVSCSFGDALPAVFRFPTFQPLFGPQSSPVHNRFQTLRSAYPNKHVGLALSGGGYRAAVMQAGVIDALEALQIRITHISAVSGGSIIGAYYALGGDPLFVSNAAAFGQFNTRRDFLDLQNLIRLLLSTPIPGLNVRVFPGYRFGRTDVQAQALDRVLLHHSSFEAIPVGAPQLMLGTTDLNSGSAVGLTATSTITRFLPARPGGELFQNVRAFYGAEDARTKHPSSFDEEPDLRYAKLSTLVAASGAFPVGFEPVQLPSLQQHRFLLTDGGVSDNSGMALLLEANRRAGLPAGEEGRPQGDPAWAVDAVIAADGGALFQHAVINPDVGAVEAARRAAEIQGAVRQARSDNANTVEGRPSPCPQHCLLFSPSLYMDDSSDYDYQLIRHDIVRGLIQHDVGYVGAESERLNEKDFSTDLLEDSYGRPFSDEQQRVFTLVAQQVVNLDWESLQILLEHRLVSVAPGYYDRPLNQLRASWLNGDEWALLIAHAKGQPVDASSLLHINEKRRNRVEALKLISMRVAGDLSNCLATFVSTATLEDALGGRAEKLFRLGQYLTFLNATKLRDVLAGPKPDDARVVTSAERKTVVCEIEALTTYAHHIQAHKKAEAMFQACLKAEAQGDSLLRTDLRDDSVQRLSTSGSLSK